MEIEMTTKQELKIRIKEVKEETRKLTIEERCMYNISKNGIIDGYIPDLISEVNDRLKEIGFIEAMYDKQIPAEILREVKGLFRTETIRDATPDEVIAWHILELDNACWQHPDCKTCVIGIAGDCLYEDCESNEANNAREILKGKEVILEVI